MNLSQEGKAAVDDLREKELVNGLKLSTEDFQPVTAFQAIKRSMESIIVPFLTLVTGVA